MEAQELKGFRKEKKMTQAQLAAWLGVKTRTVIAWENSQNPIPDIVAKRIASSAPALNPTLTLEEFNQVQERARNAGMTLDEWIAHLIKKSLMLLLLLCGVAKLMNPTDWSGDAIATAAGQGCKWFGAGVVMAWNAGSAVLASL